jgi:hypothetical protein
MKNSNRWSVAVVMISTMLPLVAQQMPARVFVTNSKSWEVRGQTGGVNGAFGGTSQGGSRPQTAEIMKTFDQRCPSVRINNRHEKADYVVTLDHEGGKGWGQKDNKVVVFNRDGDMIHSNSTAILGNAVQGACAAILSDWSRHPRPESSSASDQAPATQELLQKSTSAAQLPVQTQSPDVPRKAGVFVEMYETDAHKKRSSPEIAYQVVDDVVSYLKSQGVSITPDQSSAGYRLRLTVDRPMMKWVKVTVEAYRAETLLWQQVAESGGGLDGSHGLRVTIDRLHKLLDANMGEKGGLPVFSEPKLVDEQAK